MRAMRLGIAAAGTLLSGCLTSDRPLFDQNNARALPLTAGLYAACQHPEAGSAAETECQDIAVSHDAGGLYRFEIPAEGETTLARFKRAGSGKWAAQLWEDSDDDPFYFLAARSGDSLALSMIECEKLPDAFKRRQVARGRLEIRDGTVCVAKTAETVVAAARAWGGTDAWRTGQHLVYTKKPS